MLIAGNWKMFKGPSETRAFAEAFESPEGVDVVLCPPYPSLATAVDAGLTAYAQNVHWALEGAFTGEVSAPMLLELGVQGAVVGHSERRQFFGETDYTVAKKAAAAFTAGLIPVVCVGETLAQRDAGETMTVVETQVRHGLVELSADALEILVIAYEPVWAIGTGRTATPEQAEEVHARIRRVLREASPDGIADKVRILYGGSVKPGNVDEIMACPNVDGALVGGASLVAEDFLRIVHFEESCL